MFKKVKQKRKKQNKVHGNRLQEQKIKDASALHPKTTRHAGAQMSQPHAVNGHFLFLFCQNLEISVSFSWEEHSRRTHHESLRPAYE